MTSILDLPTEIMRLILEELYLLGYQFNSVINVCRRWREIVLHTIFRGPTQRWVYSLNHGCLVAYRGSEETSRLRELSGCLALYGGVPLRLCYSSIKDHGSREGKVDFSIIWRLWRTGDVETQTPGLVSPTASPQYQYQGSRI